MKHRRTFAIKLGSLHVSLFIASRPQRAHGLKPFAVYAQWRRRVWLQLPMRKNFAVPYERDLPYSEVLRTWQGLTVGDRRCNPSYRATRTWQQIADDPLQSPNAAYYAREQARVMARATARRLSVTSAADEPA